jgi:type IV pilus assembly protein PilV
MIFKKEGFSLIEVLIALIFLAIGILAIASLQVTAVRGNFFSNNLMQATYVAQDRLENLENMPFTSLPVGGDYSDKTITISGVVFTGTYRVVDNVAGYKEITYTVTWNDGTNHSISFPTFRSQ